MSGKGKVVGLVVFGLAIGGLLWYKNSTSASPAATNAVYTYTSGTVTFEVLTVNTNPAGFSFLILVGGNQIFQDNVVTGDTTYTEQAAGGAYVINFTPTPTNTGGTFFVYDSKGTLLGSFNVNYNGTQATG